MTKIWSIIILIIVFVNIIDIKVLYAQSHNSNNYFITGKIHDRQDGWIYLRHGEGKEKDTKIDSAKVVNHAFSFSGRVSGMEVFALGMRAKDGKGKITSWFSYKEPFFLSPGNLYIEGDFSGQSELSASGSKAQDEYNMLIKKIEPLGKRGFVISDAIHRLKKSETKKIDSLEAIRKLISNQIQKMTIAHISEYPNSVVSAYIAKSSLAGADIDILKPVYEKLSPAVKESAYGKKVLEMVQSAERTAFNGIAPAFTIPDQTGKPVSLKSAKGTYTLIDFWASWCGPCREENPHLIKAYNSYRTKGFKVVSISMDTSKEAWLKAVKDDKLTWLQLSDLKGVKSEIGKGYGITVVPMNFLIDKDDKIIGRNLRGKELIDKLNEVFNSK
ncbi:TlpA disulfide reductase family protein [Pedobacter frigoris]|uniref:TlpA disulfide reductase family protein n=1 Tax=Pedobacter frigoris TaxID=2571272 RepID=UPI0029311E74|nr:TlpA disulfide reductase family protein [Pedobacter frigoris]